MHSGCLHFFSRGLGPAQFNCAAASESTHSADFALIFFSVPPLPSPNPQPCLFFLGRGGGGGGFKNTFCSPCGFLSNTICCPMLGSSNSKRKKKKRRVGQGALGKEQVWVREQRGWCDSRDYFFQKRKRKIKKSSSVATVTCFFLGYHTLSCSCSQSD